MILGTLFNPFPDQSDLLVTQWLIRLLRRHYRIVIRRQNPFDDQAFVRFSRHDGLGGDRLFPLIQSQVSLSRELVETMTGKTSVRKDWPNIAVKVDFAIVGQNE